MTSGSPPAPLADDLSEVGRALALELLGITEPEVGHPADPADSVDSVESAESAESVEPVVSDPDESLDASGSSRPAESAPRAESLWSLASLPPLTSTEMLPPPATEVFSTHPPTVGETTVVPVVEKDRAGAARRRFHNGIEWAGVVVIAVAVALLVKLFVIQAFSIPSESMVHTLEVNDRVLVNKLSYDAHEIHRGDVVVFERPPAMASLPGDPDDLIKRVIALPGETIEAHGGTVFINGRQLIEPYLVKGTRTDNLDQPIVVPKGKIFVMGDNRTRSRDSRFIGAIDEKLVVGRAFARIWPLSRIGFL